MTLPFGRHSRRTDCLDLFTGENNNAQPAPDATDGGARLARTRQSSGAPGRRRVREITPGSVTRTEQRRWRRRVHLRETSIPFVSPKSPSQQRISVTCLL